jgi:glycogen synthase
MKTLIEIRDVLETEYPILTEVVNGENTELSEEERKETLDRWANNLYTKELEIKAIEDKAAAKAALLERLGITAEEAELLLTGNQ